MSTWAGLASNQLVDRAAIADAIAHGLFVLNSGQSIPTGTQAVTVSEAETLLQIDSAYMPTDGRMPVKSNFVGGVSTITIHNNQQTNPTFVPCTSFIYADTAFINQLVGDSSVTYYYPGGTNFTVIANHAGSDGGSGVEPEIVIQVYENGALIFNQGVNTYSGDNNIWNKLLLPNSTYMVYCFSHSYY